MTDPSRRILHCPTCDRDTPCRETESDHNPIADFRNLPLKLLLIPIAFQAGFDLVERAEWLSKEFVCLQCGEVFRECSSEPKHPHACPACDYDLRGNKSGRCPECSRTIVPPMKNRIDSQDPRQSPPSTPTAPVETHRE